MEHDLNNLPNQPACLDISPERLDSMSASELADAMEEAMNAMTEETYDPAVIDAYLEALDRKVPIPNDMSAQISYVDFIKQLQLLIPAVEPQQSIKHAKRGSRIFRSGFAAALIAACLLESMAIAQAVGIDVLGVIANWTESIFAFNTLPNDDILTKPSNNTGTTTGTTQTESSTPEDFSNLQSALAERNMPLRIPRAPDGFEIDESQLYIDPTTDNIDFYVVYVKESDHICFSLIQSDGLSGAAYEKDGSEVEIYEHAGITHYIFSNIADTVAVWNTNGMEYGITTNLTSTEVKDLIKSMYKE